MDNNNMKSPNGESSTVDGNNNDWRAQFSFDARQKIINRIMKSLEKHMPDRSPENLLQITAIATKFEERVFYAAPSQVDYLRRISLKMVTMENKPPSSGEVNSLQSNSSSSNQNAPDAGSQSMQSQMQNEGKSSAVRLTTPSQAPQNMLSHTTQTSDPSSGVQSSGHMMSTMPSVQNLITDNNAPNGGQRCNLQNMSGMLQNSIGQMQGRQVQMPMQMQERQHMQQQVAVQQNQQPSRVQQRYIYQQQMQNQLLKKRSGNIQPSLMQTHIQQQNILQQMQLQAGLQATQQSGMLQNPLSSSMQLAPAALRKHQQSLMSSQQKQQLTGKQPEEANTQQNKLLGQTNSSAEMQHHQQQKWLQQQMCQQNDISNFHQQMLSPQQQMVGAQAGVSNMQAHQQSVHFRQAQQMSMSSKLSSQGQQSQPQQKQLMNQLHSNSPHFQQQMGMDKQQLSLQRDLQQRLQASGALAQHQNVTEQQKQQLQMQRARAESSSTSADSVAQRQASITEGHEEFYQKVKSMREVYLPDLMECHKRTSMKIQQPTTTIEELENLKRNKILLERLIVSLQSPNLPPGSKEKLVMLEKQIIYAISLSKRAVSSLQQGLQQFQPHGDQLQQSQVPQVKLHDNQMKPLMQPRNLQSSVATAQQTASGPSLSTHMGVPPVHPSVMNTNPNMYTLPTSSNILNNQSLKQQQEHQLMQAHQLKQQTQQRLISQPLMQQQDQQILKQQQLPLMQQHQQQQNLLRQHKLQQGSQSVVHHNPQVHPISEINDMKVRQGMGVMSGTFQHLAYQNQQIKTGGASFSISSPQLLQAASPQLSQHSSPQVDHQSLLTSLSKNGTPLPSSNSPSIAPSPPTPLDSSPLPSNPEKQASGVSSLSNTGNNGQSQTPVSLQQTQSLVIGTPGISASPLLTEFACTEANQGNENTTMPEKSNATERPIDRLMKVVQRMQPKALAASMNQIELAMNMVDRIAGSRPGKGSRASLGEDLVNRTSCRFNAKKRKWWRHGSAMAPDVFPYDDSVDDSYQQANGLETSELESTATSRIKKCRRVEINHALRTEIREINQRLMLTVLDITKEDTIKSEAEGERVQGAVVECSFSPTILCPSLKQEDEYSSSPTLSIHLLVPLNYPNCSPILLDTVPVHLSKFYEDLFTNAKYQFIASLRCLSQPMSVGEMARSWEACARGVVKEYAEQNGGGDITSSVVTWENCATAA